MKGNAQTIIQLLRQVQLDGGTEEMLRSIFQAYELAMRLFTGSYSGSGKTTIAHLVGTASFLYELHAPTAVIAAGLLHSAYLTGDFGDGDVRITQTKRDRVKSEVGSAVEEYLFRFANLSWRPETIPSIAASLDTKGPVDRDVILIRLADDLDRHRDLGALYLYRDSADAHEFIRCCGPVMLAMARQLGYPSLANELDRVFCETLHAEIPAFLRDLKWKGSFPVIPPQSYRKRFGVLAREAAMRLLGQPRNFFGL
jgi:(p)ppGpp synthase/HD superfamily hydrolase